MFLFLFGTNIHRNHIPLCDGFKVEVTQYTNCQDVSATILDVSNIDFSLYILGYVFYSNTEYMG